MGYYTSFCMSVSPAKGNNRVSSTISKLEEDLIDKEVERMNVFESGCAEDGWFAYAKWYDFEKDMLLLSTRLPDFIFCLEGDGEDSDDKWMYYYHDGKVMYGGLEIIRHDFDPGKLIKPRTVPNKTYCYEEDA